MGFHSSVSLIAKEQVRNWPLTPINFENQKFGYSMEEVV